jgi:hypothetical protein
MMAFPSMLINAAEKAAMKVPPDADDFLAKDYPHFAVFCALQLNRPVHHGEHWENAKIIAAVHEDKIMTNTLEDFLALGLRWQQ